LTCGNGIPGKGYPMPKLLVVDDHAIVRKALLKILKDSDASISVDEAGNGQEALARVLQASYELVLMDISMPGRGGLEVLKEIRSRRPGLPVLVISMHSEEEYVVRALRAGASGYLTKDSAAEELIEAIKKVVEGGRYVSAALAETLAFRLGQDDEAKPHETLSDREFEVFRLIAAGKKPSQIAKTLHLSVKTVNTYRERVLEKMGLKPTAEIIRYAIRNNLVE